MASDRRGPTYRYVTLADGAAGDHCLRAVCRCGASAAVDIAPWLAEGLAASPLARLEDRLRCAECGARSVALAIDPEGRAPPRGRIYVFR